MIRGKKKEKGKQRDDTGAVDLPCWKILPLPEGWFERRDKDNRVSYAKYVREIFSAALIVSFGVFNCLFLKRTARRRARRRGSIRETTPSTHDGRRICRMAGRRSMIPSTACTSSSTPSTLLVVFFLCFFENSSDNTDCVAL